MPITKDKILERVQQLEKERDQHLANANAVHGALQDCQYWLAQLEAAEEAC